MMQILPLLPGFSRTGSTIAGSLLVGVAHGDGLRFSFLLATPIIGAAAALKLPGLFASRNLPAIGTALLGATGAMIASYLSAKFLTKYFRHKRSCHSLILCALRIGGPYSAASLKT